MVYQNVAPVDSRPDVGAAERANGPAPHPGPG